MSTLFPSPLHPTPTPPHRYNKTKSRKFDRVVLAVSVGLSFFFKNLFGVWEVNSKVLLGNLLACGFL